jgi:hypothetical protein
MLRNKLIMVAAMLALVVVAAWPAIAQVTVETGIEEVESGDAEGVTEVGNWGDLSNQCVTSGNFTNTGNAVSTAGVSQYQTETDDIEIEGSSIVFGGEIAGECDQSILVW